MREDDSHPPLTEDSPTTNPFRIVSIPETHNLSSTPLASTTSVPLPAMHNAMHCNGWFPNVNYFLVFTDQSATSPGGKHLGAL